MYSGTPPYGHLVITANVFLSRKNGHTFSLKNKPIKAVTR